MDMQRLLAEVDKVLDPTKTMTALERHIYEQETIACEMYAGAEDELEDPFEILARKEEEELAEFGHNLNNVYFPR